jgi:hypothetical protein
MGSASGRCCLIEAVYVRCAFLVPAVLDGPAYVDEPAAFSSWAVFHESAGPMSISCEHVYMLAHFRRIIRMTSGRTDITVLLIALLLASACNKRTKKAHEASDRAC